MNAYLLANGNLVVPIRAESDGVIGDALVVLAPSHPDHERWMDFADPAPIEIERQFGNVDGETEAQDAN